MYCLKCGKDTKDERVFCQECLESMDRYPVKPGTAIQLHRREALATARKVAKNARPVSTEDQVEHLRKIVFWMGILLVIAVVLLAVTTGLWLANSHIFSKV